VTAGWPTSVEGFRRVARRKLPKPVFDFVEGGAEDEQTVRANREQFEQVRFVPRVLVDVSKRDMSTSVAGVPMRLPIILAPTGLVGLIHPDGETAAVVVAARQQLLAVVSGHGTYTLEEVAASAPNTSPWFDIFPWRNRDFLDSMIDRAAAAGFTGLCLTLDSAIPGNRERDLANGWAAPPRLTRNFFEYARHPLWVSQVLRHRRGTMRNFDAGRPPLRSFIRDAARSAGATVGLISQRMSWDDLSWIRDRWPGPLAVKGAFGLEDARRLTALGVNVIFVGNHGGRQLDGLQTGLEQLNSLGPAIGDRVDIVVDGGIRRGSDIVKAICLGAKACMIGRAWVYGLAVGGTSGAEAVIKVLEREIDMALTLLGASAISDLDPSFIARAKLSQTMLQADAHWLDPSTERQLMPADQPTQRREALGEPLGTRSAVPRR
jgi:isopentenyl diphosphate isomerase/L-lactate dehydrogenase-like FMN-dependent dehydrogenase